MFVRIFAMLLASGHGSLTLQNASNPTCPQTKLYGAFSKDAAGALVWSECPYNRQQNECHDIRMGGALGVKFCGPGKLTLSRMTCNNHAYKADVFTHDNTQWTTECEQINIDGTVVGPMGDAPGFVGSFKLDSC